MYLSSDTRVLSVTCNTTKLHSCRDIKFSRVLLQGKYNKVMFLYKFNIHYEIFKDSRIDFITAIDFPK